MVNVMENTTQDTFGSDSNQLGPHPPTQTGTKKFSL